MRIKKLFPLVIVFLVLGCVQQTGEETKLQENEGLGILLFGMPTNPANPVIEVEKVPPKSHAFLSLILRNNAEGNIARDIRVSLDNVDPFKIIECGIPHNATDFRDEECCGYDGIYDDICDGKTDQYRTHRINRMNPDEELEFFWVLESPTKYTTGNMYYEHTIYALVSYHYHTSIYVGIAAMNFQEYSSRKSSGAPLSGTSTSSAGEIKVISLTNEPVLYSQSSPGNFILKLQLVNQGTGITDPNKKINLTIEYDKNLVGLGEEADIQEATEQEKSWFKREYGAKSVDGLLLKQIDNENLLTGSYLINIPFEMLESTANYQIIPFYIRISYDYMLESQAKIGVIPS